MTLKRVTNYYDYALEKIYSGPVNPRTGERIYAGVTPGCEFAMLAGFPGVLMANYFPFRWAFGTDYDYHSFDFDRDVEKMNQKLAKPLNANSPDLSAFHRKSGKLLLYAGSSDMGVPMEDTITYYERLIRQEGGLEKTKEFARLFVVPGLGHMYCGPGINNIGQVPATSEVPFDREHNMLCALMEWVEKGLAPEKIVGTAYQDLHYFSGEGSNIRFQRPAYPYPFFPKYVGGDENDPGSYIPEEHKRSLEFSTDREYLNS